MKLKLFQSIFSLLLFIILLAGCESMESRWKTVQSTNTIKAYEEFIKDYPESPFINVAKKKTIDLQFENAKNMNSIQAYKEFINKYPNSVHTRESQNLLELMSFEDVSTSNNLEKLNQFLEAFPKSKYIDEVKGLIASNLLQQALESKNIKLLQEIADNYPETQSANQAVNEIRKTQLDQEWKNLRNITDYRNFFAKHRNADYFVNKRVHVRNKGTYVMGKTTAFVLLDIDEMPDLNIEVPGPVVDKWEGGTFTELGDGLAIATNKDKPIEVTLIMLPNNHHLRKKAIKLETYLIAVVASARLPKNEKTYVIGSVR